MYFKGLALLVLISLPCVFSWDVADQYVEYIDKEDIDMFADRNRIVLVHWFASWCTYCKEFAPKWSKMSDIVHEGMNNFRIVKVELGDDKGWKDRYQVKAFPDFGVFVNGEYYPYSGKKEAGDILQFAVNRTADGILHVAHQLALTYLKENSNAISIGLVKEGSQEEEVFKKNVLRDQNVLFILPHHQLRDEILETIGKSMPSIYVQKTFDDYNTVFEGEFTDEKVKEFVLENTIPTVFPTANPRYKDYFYKHGKEWMAVLVDAPDAAYPSLTTQTFVDLCKAKRNEVVCFYVGNNEKSMYSFFITGQAVSYPALIVAHHTRGYYFRAILPSMGDEPVDSLEFFLDGVMAGSIKMIMKSQNEEDLEDLGYLKSVVGTTFQSKVMESAEDVVVFFYSKYCEHCTKVLKRAEKIAEYFKEDDSIRLYKYNSQENDVDLPEISAKYFHSVLYVRKGEKPEVIEYPRSRKIWRTKALLKWITEQRAAAPTPEAAPVEEEEL